MPGPAPTPSALTEAREGDAQFREARRALLLLSRAVGGMGHEFNNLLSRVIGLAEEIQGAPDAQVAHACAETLMVTAERGAETVRRYMAFAGYPAADVQALELKQALEAWRVDDPADDLTIDVEACSATVMADPLLLRISLDELLKNARQSGATQIDVTCTREPGTLPVGLVVSDDGSGMDAPTLARAKASFFGDGSRTGVGVGLGLVQEAMNQCGGKLRLASHPGKGTVAKLLLPTPGSSVGADS